MKRHSNDEVNENDTNSKEESSNTLLYFLAQRRQRKNRTTNVDAIITRRQYLELEHCDGDTNPLLYWKANAKPKDVLAQLARKDLCIPSSSVESERVFSTAGLIVNDRRSSLKPETVDMLVFLHKNLCSTKISKLE
ncbi:uncharacterized protein LOC118750359 [Rhagoletis pomonella]|nr:uncharacterized protein LOC118750359 [Rhagoletis pomonella]